MDRRADLERERSQFPETHWNRRPTFPSHRGVCISIRVRPLELFLHVSGRSIDSVEKFIIGDVFKSFFRPAHPLRTSGSGADRLHMVDQSSKIFDTTFSANLKAPIAEVSKCFIDEPLLPSGVAGIS